MVTDLRAETQRILSLMPRGTISRLCEETTCTKPEVSNWLAERRNITDEKIVVILQWLMCNELISLETRV